MLFFLAGCAVGAMIGVVIIALCAAASSASRREESWSDKQGNSSDKNT